MENIYKAYVREINGRTYYFVKKFNCFPEYQGTPQILDSYGMHQNFLKACSIAHIIDKKIINELSVSLQLRPESGRVIQMSKVKSFSNSMWQSTRQVLSHLRLVNA